MDTNNLYDIDTLINTFKDHHVRAEEDHKIREAKYIEEFGHPFPHDCSFSISMALHEICKHVKVIEDTIKCRL